MKVDKEVKYLKEPIDPTKLQGDPEAIEAVKKEMEESEEEDEEIEDLEKHSEKEKEEIIGTTQIPQDEEKDYLIKALEEGDKNVGLYYKYKALGLKQSEGKELNEEEKQFISDMNRVYALDKQIEEEQSKREQEEIAMREKVLQEYHIIKGADSSKIDVVPLKTKTYRGGDSIPKLIKFALAMKKAKTKGGKVLVKVTRDRRFFIEWTNKDFHFVEFWTKDEKGNLIPEVTRFTEYKYTYEGTPVPVLFAIQGYATGFDFYDQYRKDITSEMVSRIASRERHSGYLEGLNLADKRKKNDLLETLMRYMPLILIVGLLGLGWMMYQMYGQMTEMYKIVTNPGTVQAIQSAAQIAAQDANALIVR